MARKYSNVLFDLIHSLNSAEKRYLQIQSSNYFKEKDNKHLKLLQLLIAQKTPDDAIIKQKIYGGKKIRSNTYAELKKYLYNFILKTLISYDESHSEAIQVRMGILKVKVLYKRGLIQACRGLLDSLESKARNLNDKTLLLEIYSWQKKIALKTLDTGFVEKHNPIITKNETDLIRRLSLIIDLKKCFDQLFLVRMKYANMPSEAQLKTIHEILDSLPDVSEYHDDQQIMRWVFNNRIYFHYLTQDEKNYYEDSKRLYEMLKSNKYTLQEEPGELVTQVGRLILGCNQLDRFDESVNYFNDFLMLSKTKGIGTIDKQRAICYYYLNKLIYLDLKGDVKDGVKLIEEFTQKYSISFYKTYARNFYFVFTSVYFRNEDYSQAIKCAQELLETGLDKRKDFQVFVRCLLLICNYELGNTLYVKSLIRSTKRYLKKDFKSIEFETLLIKLIQNLLNPVLMKREIKDYFKDFRLELNKTIGIDEQKINPIISTVNIWTDSKLLNVSMIDLSKKAYENLSKGKQTL